MMYSDLRYAREGDVALITFARPDALNALRQQSIRELLELAGGTDDGVRRYVRRVCRRAHGAARTAEICQASDYADRIRNRPVAFLPRLSRPLRNYVTSNTAVARRIANLTTEVTAMTWWSLGIFTAIVGNSSAAQLPQDIAGSELCPRCSIVRERLTVLDRSAIDGSSEIKAVDISPRGEYWVTSYVGGPETLLRRFMADGRLVATLGRKGQGPLEFMAATLVLRTRADTLLVFDPHVGRVTIVDPDLKYVRAVADRRLARAQSGIALPDGRVITSGALRTSDGIGQPLHLYDDSLRYRRSFGAISERVHRPSDDAKLVRVFGAARDGFWAAHAEEYVLERWSTQLTRTAILRRSVHWFVPPSGTEEDPPPPKPMVLATQQYGDSLWILAAVPDREWKRALGKRFEVRGRPRYVIDDDNRYYDSIVEVVDLRSKRVVKSQRFDELLVGLFGHQLTGGEVTDKDGSPSFTIWKLRFERETRRTNFR